MEAKDRKDLQREVDHIFESGANEIRIMEMVERFIDRRYVTREYCQTQININYNEGFEEGKEEHY